MPQFVRGTVRVAGPVAAVLFSIGLVTAGAQAPAGGQAPGAGPAPAGAQAPAAPAAGGGGRGIGGGRGGGRGMDPSALRAVPAETQTAKAKNPNWKGPRTPWGDPDISGQFSTDDMNSVPMSRNQATAGRESLTPEEFMQRARGDEQQKFSAVNLDTFLRNERGTRTFGWTSFVVEPATGVLPPMVAAYRTARRSDQDGGTFDNNHTFDDFDDFTLYERCITRGIFGSTLPVIYGNGIRIAQSPTEVVITYEMIHDTRIIPLDNRPFPSPAIKQYMGSSRGHWEGDTLVVETRNLTDLTSIGANGNGSRHSDQMKLKEWFTRVDPDMIEYRVHVEDPVAYTAPFTLRMMFTTQPDYEVLEYSCHEGNGAVGFALSAERAYDRKVAEAKAKGLPIPVRDMSSPYGGPAAGLEVLDINTGQRTVTPGRAGGAGGPGGPGGGGRGRGGAGGGAPGGGAGGAGAPGAPGAPAPAAPAGGAQP